MVEYRDAQLAELLSQDVEDRCNGFYPRHLLTEVGDIELLVPRTRTFSAADILNQFARRSTNVDRMILPLPSPSRTPVPIYLQGFTSSWKNQYVSVPGTSYLIPNRSL